MYSYRSSCNIAVRKALKLILNNVSPLLLGQSFLGWCCAPTTTSPTVSPLIPRRRSPIRWAPLIPRRRSPIWWTSLRVSISRLMTSIIWSSISMIISAIVTVAWLMLLIITWDPTFTWWRRAFPSLIKRRSIFSGWSITTLIGRSIAAWLITSWWASIVHYPTTFSFQSLSIINRYFLFKINSIVYLSSSYFCRSSFTFLRSASSFSRSSSSRFPLSRLRSNSRLASFFSRH